MDHCPIGLIPAGDALGGNGGGGEHLGGEDNGIQQLWIKSL